MNVELKMEEYVLFVVTNRCFSGSEAVNRRCCFNAIEIYSIQTGEQSVMLWELKVLRAFYMIPE